MRLASLPDQPVALDETRAVLARHGAAELQDRRVHRCSCRVHPPRTVRVGRVGHEGGVEVAVAGMPEHPGRDAMLGSDPLDGGEQLR